MRFIAAMAAVVLSSSSALACDIGPLQDVKLEPEDQAVLISLGKAIDAKALQSAPVAAIFSEPPALLTLSPSDSQTLSEALAGLHKTTACNADGLTMERILADDTPGIRFLKQIEACLADACVDNQ